MSDKDKDGAATEAAKQPEPEKEKDERCAAVTAAGGSDGKTEAENGAHDRNDAAEEMKEEEDTQAQEEELEDAEEEAKAERAPFVVGDTTYPDAAAVSQAMGAIVHTKYALGSYLTGADKELALALLDHHPDAAAKKGAGVSEVAVTLHPAFRNRCLMVVRTDGTTEDFSVGRCIDAIFDRKRAGTKANRVQVPKAVVRFDMTLTAPTPPPEQPPKSEIYAAVREALTAALEKLEEGVLPPAKVDLELCFDGTRKMQLLMLHDATRAARVAEKLPGECAEGVCAEVEQKCGWRAAIDRVAVAEGAEEKMYWERRIVEQTKQLRGASHRGGRGGRGGHRGGHRGAHRGGMKRNRGDKEHDAKPAAAAAGETEPRVAETHAADADSAPQQQKAQPQKGPAVDVLCRPTAGQRARQTTSVGTAGRPPVIASARKRPRPDQKQQ